jgi:hypothetical protein
MSPSLSAPNDYSRRQSPFGFRNESSKTNRVQKNRAQHYPQWKGGREGRIEIKGTMRSANMDADKLIIEPSVIIGNCDLLIQNTEPNSEHARRLVVIQDMADTVRRESVEHRRQLEAEMRKSGAQKAS